MSGQGAFPRRKVVAAVAAEVQNNSVGRLLLPTRKAGAKADAKDAQQKRRKEPQQKRTFEKFEDPNAARKAAAAAEGHGGETRNLLEVGAAGQRPKNRISLKNLKEGTTLIGSVTKIQTHELVFDLPYGLVGVCKKDQCYEGDDNARLDELFRVGQLFPCVVRSLGKKQGKHLNLELSIRPSLVNAGVAAGNVLPGLSLPVVVTSLTEEHVVEASFGVPGLKAILKKKAAGQVRVGQIVSVCIDRFHAPSGAAQCRVETAGSRKGSPLDDEIDVNALKVGSLVQARVAKVLKDADGKLEMRFCGAFRGVLFPEYGPCAVASSNMIKSKSFEKNSLHPCRVLARVPAAGGDDSSQPEVHLCALPHVVAWETADFRKQCEESRPLLREGSFVDATVTKLEEFNARMAITGWNKDENLQNSAADADAHLTAVCHVSKMDASTSAHAAAATSSEKKRLMPEHVQEGATVKARVLGFNQLDRVVMLGMSNDLLEEKIMCASDLNLGQLVRGDVSRVVPDRCVFVKVERWNSYFCTPGVG
eukprot:g10998.t1